MIKAVGLLFLTVTGLCWILPSLRHLFKETPPAIINLGYSIITLYGLLLGVRIVYFKELRGSIGQYLEGIFVTGARAGRADLVMAAVFVSLHFVLGNLTRSYYNLHKIEDDNGGSVLRGLISKFGRARKTVECALRVFMFVTIAWIVRTIASLEHETPNSGSLLGVEVFRLWFDTFWHFAIIYYMLLLVWDYVIWSANRANAPHHDPKIDRIVWIEAVPVHIAGLTVSLAMCLPRHLVSLSPFVDLSSLVALGAAAVGCALLLLSVWMEAPEISKALRGP